MINNVVLVSSVWLSDSVIHIHIFILFQIVFPFRLLQNTFIYLFIYLWLSWVFLAVQGLSLVTESGGYSPAAV